GAPFEPINDGDHLLHLQAELLDTLDRQQRRSPRRDNILDDYHVVAGLHGAFDVAVRAVSLRFLAHEDSAQGVSSYASHRDDGPRDRIGADRHAPHGFGKRAPDKLQDPLADQLRPDRIEGYLLEIEVILGL